MRPITTSESYPSPVDVIQHHNLALTPMANALILSSQILDNWTLRSFLIVLPLAFLGKSSVEKTTMTGTQCRGTWVEAMVIISASVILPKYSGRGTTMALIYPPQRFVNSYWYRWNLEEGLKLTLLILRTFRRERRRLKHPLLARRCKSHSPLWY